MGPLLVAYPRGMLGHSPGSATDEDMTSARI